jgi:hypothetical protein
LLAHELEESWRAFRLANDLVARPLEQAGEPLAEQHVIVSKHDPGSHRSIIPPRPLRDGAAKIYLLYRR